VAEPGGRVMVKVADEAGVEAVLEAARAKRARVHSLVPRTQTLEDIFVDMVKTT
jgi:ABC-2 type transport system ATP-binding protein